MNRIQKGDQVEVIAGNERGVRGEVQRVIPREERLVVKGVNIRRKHQGATPGVRTQTGIIEFEAPIHLSNVMPICPACDQPTRVGYTTRETGTKVRVCRKCDGMLD